jgi:hypothetical protein
MNTVCEKCGDRFNDEYVSTCCPHRGIGYCRACDCVVCCCPNGTTNKKSNKYGTKLSAIQKLAAYWRRWKDTV